MLERNITSLPVGNMSLTAHGGLHCTMRHFGFDIQDESGSVFDITRPVRWSRYRLNSTEYVVYPSWDPMRCHWCFPAWRQGLPSYRLADYELALSIMR